MATPRAVPAGASVAWLRRFAGTTPGVLSLLAVMLVALCMLTGVVSGGQLDARIAQHREVLDRSEPLAYAAQDLYAALSAADAAATASFLTGGIEVPAMRERYQGALADAAGALADVTAGAGDLATRTAAADISVQLTTYTGLVEAARVNNRQGFPVGSAYLREASALMQNSLLPGAQQIFGDKMAALDADQRAVGSIPVVTLVLLALVLVALVAGSVITTRRTNRMFNVGLLVAAATVFVVAGWVMIGATLAGAAIADAREQGNRYADLAGTRILVQQVRTDETLQLITRGDITASEAAFAERMEELRGDVPLDNALQSWVESHHKQVEFYLAGDYGAALNQAIGPDPSASPAQFGAVEAGLRDAIEDTRTQLRGDVARAGNVLSWSPTGTLILMVVAAAAAVVGLWPRLKEFL